MCIWKHVFFTCFENLLVELVLETCPTKSADGVKSIDITITAQSSWLPVKSAGRDLLAEYVLYICFVLITVFQNIPIFWTSAAQLRMKSSLISGCPQWLEAVARHIYNLTRFTSSEESLIKSQSPLFIATEKVRKEVCW